jgi:hypothetical protein
MADSYLLTKSGADHTREMLEAEETRHMPVYVEEICSAFERLKELERLMQKLEQENARFHELLGVAQASVGVRPGGWRGQLVGVGGGCVAAPS